MADWKFQAKLMEAGIELDDPALNQTFVEQARSFLTLTQNSEASPEKLAELDDELCELFDSLHTVDLEEDLEKVEAIKENYSLKKQLRENQEALDKMKADLEEKEKRLAEKDTELEETRKKIPVEPPMPPTPPEPPKPTEAEIQAKKRNRLLAALAEAVRLNKSIQKGELIEMGVPANLFEGRMTFDYEGFTFDRQFFNQRWDISK